MSLSEYSGMSQIYLVGIISIFPYFLMLLDYGILEKLRLKGYLYFSMTHMLFGMILYAFVNRFLIMVPKKKLFS